MIKKLFYVAAIIVLTLLPQRFAAADNGPEHQQEQTRPIRLGTSGGNINDSSTNFCCGGTLGALVQNSNGQYILSNNHVLAGTNNALLGEEIIQPGLIDQYPVCLPDANDAVAHLTGFVAIKFKKATGQLENYMMIYNLKKDIAKINTLIREKEISMDKNS